MQTIDCRLATAVFLLAITEIAATAHVMMSHCLHRQLIYGKEDPQRQIVDLFFPQSIELVHDGLLGKVLDAVTTRGGTLLREHARPSDVSKGKTPKLLIFVHGGAWVSEDNKDHYDLAKFIAEHSDTVVALIDYRLSSKTLGPDAEVEQEKKEQAQPEPSHKAVPASKKAVRHPDHIADCFKGLELVLSKDTAKRYGYEASGAVMVGHSAGGWMTLATALDSQHPDVDVEEDKGSLIGDIPPLSPYVRSCIKFFVCTESIFSLVELLHRYPDYKDFVVPAFYPPDAHPTPPYAELAKAGVESWEPIQEEGAYYEGNDEPVIFVFHSAEDTLLDKRYNHHGVDLLRSKDFEVIVDSTSFHGDHDDLLHNDGFWMKLIHIVHGRGNID